jgi:hypothetical protein
MTLRAWLRRRRRRQVRRTLMGLPLELRMLAVALLRATPR